MKHTLTRAVAVCGLALAIAPAAHAQLSPGAGAPGGGINRTIGEPPPDKNPEMARPPPALPGARSNPDLVVPADKNAMDMSPNDALFDAINRGDIASARDALNHGADLDARNVLGMTPIDLSIDLARNDISFLLLSMRGGGTVTKGPPPTPAQSLAQAKAARQKELAEQKKAAQMAAKQAGAVKPVAQQTPRLFAGDGGTPRPDAGFLGFDQHAAQ